MQLLKLIFACIFGLQLNIAHAQTYFLEASSGVQSAGERKRAEAFLQAFRTEAKRVVPGQFVSRAVRADTIFKPVFKESANGTQLMIERHDLGFLWSTVEVPDWETLDEASWSRVSSRVVRDLIFGRLRGGFRGGSGSEP